MVTIKNDNLFQSHRAKNPNDFCLNVKVGTTLAIIHRANCPLLRKAKNGCHKFFTPDESELIDFVENNPTRFPESWGRCQICNP